MVSRSRHLNTPLVLTVVAVAAILVWVAILFLHAWYHHRVSVEVERKVVDQPATEWIALREAQSALLSDYEWIDREEGIVRLPIERAMELVVADAGGEKP